jgi:hypothetical protein
LKENLDVLTFEDCLGLCELTEDEIEAIGQHEHLPQIIALAMGENLLHKPEGDRIIRQYILDDIDDCREKGDLYRLARFERALEHFVAAHPGCGATAADAPQR